MKEKLKKLRYHVVNAPFEIAMSIILFWLMSAMRRTRKRRTKFLAEQARHE
ncbi:MAG TPA: hypothetical protein VLE72_03645 [Candidatus Saccharimonadales bacterium]|nr:hypothetical protein [Candidatus Saccharimonadales bacterium]